MKPTIIIIAILLAAHVIYAANDITGAAVTKVFAPAATPPTPPPAAAPPTPEAAAIAAEQTARQQETEARRKLNLLQSQLKQQDLTIQKADKIVPLIDEQLSTIEELRTKGIGDQTQLNERKMKLEEEKKMLIAHSENAKGRKEQIETEIEAAKKELEDKQKATKKAAEGTFEYRLTETERKLEESKLLVSEKESNVELTKADLEIQRGAADLAQANVDAARAKLDALKASKSDPNSIKSAEAELKAANTALDAANKDWSEAVNDLADAEKALSDVQKQQSDAQKELAELEKQRPLSSFASGIQAVINTFGSFIRAYYDYAGLGQYTALMIGEEELEKRRAKVNKQFCDTIVLGGQQCWASKICETDIEFPPGDAVVVARTPSGSPKAVGHVEGEKSLAFTFKGASRADLINVFGERNITIESQTFNLGDPTLNTSTLPDVTGRLIKVTFAFSNIEDDNRMINIIFADGQTETKYYEPDLSVEKSSTTTRLGTNPVSFFTPSNYTSVCLTFMPSLPKFGGGNANRICNKLSEYEGGATPPPGAPTTPASSGAPTPQKPSEGQKV